jgi:hypothetical protein
MVLAIANRLLVSGQCLKFHSHKFGGGCARTPTRFDYRGEQIEVFAVIDIRSMPRSLVPMAIACREKETRDLLPNLR